MSQTPGSFAAKSSKRNSQSPTFKKFGKLNSKGNGFGRNNFVLHQGSNTQSQVIIAGRHDLHHNQKGSRNSFKAATAPSLPEGKRFKLRQRIDTSNQPIESDASSDIDMQISHDLFKPVLKRMPSAVEDVIENMGTFERDRMRMELGIKQNRSSMPSIDSDDSFDDVISKHSARSARSSLSRSRRSIKRKSSRNSVVISDKIVTDHLKKESRNEDSQQATIQSMVGSPSPVLSRHSQAQLQKKFKSITVTSVENLNSKRDLHNSDSEQEEKGQFLIDLMKSRLKAKLNDTRSSYCSAMSKRSKQPVKLTIDMVASILLKHPNDRTKDDQENVHKYMVDNVKFFQTVKEKEYLESAQKGTTPHLTREDKMKMYEVMLYKIFKKGDVLCKFGDWGDRFFIILEGTVGIRVPMNIDTTYNCTWDIFLYVLKNLKHVRMFRDQNSRECSAVIKSIGRKLLKSLNFTKVTHLIEFLIKVERIDPQLFEEVPELNETRLKVEQYKIKAFREQLQRQLDRIQEKPSGSVGRVMPLKDRIKVKLQVMEHVNQLGQGFCFGQDSLIGDTTRNATCTVMSDKVITAVLTKADFKRVLLERERQHIDMKIGQILMFDLFKDVPKRRLKNVYRFFFNQKTQMAYVAYRNQYLYRQDQAVDGIYCILSGHVQRIKETRETTTNKDIQSSPQKAADDLNKSEDRVNILDQLKKKKAKQIVLTILSKGETLGVDEIVNKAPTRQFSIQVSSESCVYLYLPAKQFKDKFFNQSFAMKHSVCEKMELQDKWIEDLEARKNAFLIQNTKLKLPITKVGSQDQQNLNDSSQEMFTMKLLCKKEDAPEAVVASQSNPQVIKSLAKHTDIRNNAPQTSKMSSSHPNPFAMRETRQSQSMSQSVEMLSLSQPKEIAIESTKQKLDRQIEQEIQKDQIDMNKLIQSMRDRRSEIANEMSENIHRGCQNNWHENMHKACQGNWHLDSKSKDGKITENKIVNRFNAVHETNKDRQKLKKLDKKLSIEIITNRLGKDASHMSEMWKNERQQDEKLKMILQSLSSDKRMQRSLQVFSVHLPEFLEHLKKQDLIYLKKLKVPFFKGNLLLDGRDKTEKERLHLEMLSQISQKKNKVGRRISRIQSSQTMRPSMVDSQYTLSHIHSKPNYQQMIMISPRGRSQDKNRGAYEQNNKSAVMSSVSPTLSHRKRPTSQAKSGKSSRKSTIRPFSSEQFDIMKVFYEWYQYHTSSTIKERKTVTGRRNSEADMTERKRETEKRAQELSIATPGGALSLGTVKHNQRPEMRRAFSALDVSAAQSVLSQRSQSRDITKAPTLPLSPTNPFKSSGTRNQNQPLRINKTIDMVKSEQVSDAEDPISVGRQVTFKPKPSGDYQVNSVNNEKEKHMSQYLSQEPLGNHRVIIKHRQQSKWLRQVANIHKTLQQDFKKNPFAADAIPEEQHRASLAESEGQQITISRLMKPLSQQLPIGAIIQTEPQTSKNRNSSIGFNAVAESSYGNDLQISHSVSAKEQNEQKAAAAEFAEEEKTDSQAIRNDSPENEYLVNIKQFGPNLQRNPHDIQFLINLKSPASSALDVISNMDQISPQQMQSPMRPGAQSARELLEQPSSKQKIEVELNEDLQSLTQRQQIQDIQKRLYSRALQLSDKQTAQFTKQGPIVEEDQNQTSDKPRIKIPISQETLSINRMSYNSKFTVEPYQKEFDAKSSEHILAQIVQPQGIIKTVDFNSHIYRNSSAQLLHPSASINQLQSANSTFKPPINQNQANTLSKTVHDKTGVQQPGLVNNKKSSWVSPLAIKKQQSLQQRANKALMRNRGTRSVALLPDQVKVNYISHQQLTNIHIDPNSESAAQLKYFSESKQASRKIEQQFNRMSIVSEMPGGGQQHISSTIQQRIAQNNFSKYHAGGLRPTTKVLVNQPNPRFSYQSKLSSRPTTSNQALDKGRSEQKLTGPSSKLGNGKNDLLSKQSTIETLEKASIIKQQHLSNPSQISAMPASKRKLVKKRNNQKSQPSLERQAKGKPYSHFAKNMFNPKQMNKNLQLQSAVIHDQSSRKTSKNQRVAAQGKFTDRMIQELQKKAQVTSSRDTGFANYQRESKPAILGSLQCAKLTPRMPHMNTIPSSRGSSQFLQLDSLSRQNSHQNTIALKTTTQTRNGPQIVEFQSHNGAAELGPTAMKSHYNDLQ